MRRRRSLTGLYLLPFLVALAGCQTLKNVPEQEYLLDKVRMQSEGRPSEISNSDLLRYVRQHPNEKVLFVRFHLWLYNLGKRNAETGLSGWLRRIGEPPAIYSEESALQSKSNLELYLRNRGYYEGTVDWSAIPNTRRRATVEYLVSFGRPTLIRSLRRQVEDSTIAALISQAAPKTLLRVGARMDKTMLDAERKRIEAVLRNAGYFNFSSEFIGFVADTTGHRYEADLSLQVPLPGLNYSPQAMRRYVLDSLHVFTKYDPVVPSSGNRDSLISSVIGAVRYHYPKRSGIRLPVVNQLLILRHDSMLRYDHVTKTQDNLLNLGLYRQANFEFRERRGYERADTIPGQLHPIDGSLYLTRFPVQGYQVEALLTASGELGMEGSLTYRHRNLFQGAEQLEVRFQAQLEALRRRKLLDFKTAMEFSWRASLTIPRFLLPFGANEFITRYQPVTRFTFTYNYQRRPDYRRTLSLAGISYAWRDQGAFSYVVTPAEVSVVKIFSIDPAFAERISRSYLSYSYISQLITTTSASFTYQQPRREEQMGNSVVRCNLELSGNALWALHRWFAKSSSTGEYRMFELPFSQYVKADANYAIRMRLGKYHSVAFRLYAGMGYPYGNSKGLPFEKKFYQGGANGVRAWQARDLGPGSYRDSELNYPNQTGDIKLEGNVEYRFQLVWKLEGALFLDAGNIWAIRKEAKRPGAHWEFNRFYREIAMGYGIGLRMNLNFFILRTDLGIRLYDPYRSPDGAATDSWIPFDRPYTGNDLVLHLGVGYPF